MDVITDDRLTVDFASVASNSMPDTDNFDDIQLDCKVSTVLLGRIELVTTA